MRIAPLTENRNYQFLALNTLGWAGYCVASFISAFYAGKLAGHYQIIAISSMLGFAAVLPLRFIYRSVWDSRVAIRILVVLVGSYGASLAWTAMRNSVHWHLLDGTFQPQSWTDYFWGVSFVYYIFISWSCLYFGIKFYQGMQEASQRALRATSLAHEAQLKMLRYQLNPHFLFNTLNAISTLILDNQAERANRMITRLSRFLRYSLDNDPLHKVTLEQELSTLELYLGIEKVRFDDRLELDFQLDDETKKALVPSLILQPLVENAVKYAIARSEMGGIISLRAKVFANELLLELRDTGPGVKLVEGRLPAGRGVGIQNTRDRLEQLYGSDHSFTVSNLEPRGLQISIRIPYEVTPHEKNTCADCRR